MAGDDIIFETDPAAAADAEYVVLFQSPVSDTKTPDIRIPATRGVAGSLTVRAPRVDGLNWADKLLRLERRQKDTTEESANTVAVRIAPGSNAVIESIGPDPSQFNDIVKVIGTGFFAPPEQIVLKVGEIAAKTVRVSPDGDWFTAHIEHERKQSKNVKFKDDPAAWLDQWNDKFDAGTRPVSAIVWGVPATIRRPDNETDPLTLRLWRPADVGYKTDIGIATAALAVFIAVTGLVALLYRSLKRRRGLVAALLLEPETQTYSLSRAQFFWWLAIIAYGYLFLFFGHGIYQGDWSFPSLEGFASTFLISLGTLLFAQLTDNVKGSKGAGVVHPTAADLIVHGGVLAPERVQQVVWTVLTGLGFLWIVLKTYSSSAGLPQIPNELLLLMGLSSAGYLGGKLARKAGPVIQRVEVKSGSVVLNVFGQNLSPSPRVLVDSIELEGERFRTIEPDPSSAEFVKGLEILLPERIAKSREEWFSRARVVVIINPDTQRAEWQLDLPAVTSVKAGAADATGSRQVTIRGKGLETGAVLVVPRTGEEVPLLAMASATEPTQWTAKVSSWPTTPADVAIRAASGAHVLVGWRPPGDDQAPAAPPADQPLKPVSVPEKNAAAPEGVIPGGGTGAGATVQDAVRNEELAEEHVQHGDKEAEDQGTAGGGG